MVEIDYKKNKHNISHFDKCYEAKQNNECRDEKSHKEVENWAKTQSWGDISLFVGRAFKEHVQSLRSKLVQSVLDQACPSNFLPAH